LEAGAADWELEPMEEVTPVFPELAVMTLPAGLP
jgi:hypothetical protein